MIDEADRNVLAAFGIFAVAGVCIILVLALVLGVAFRLFLWAAG